MMDMPHASTGRIHSFLKPTARRLIFGDRADDVIDTDLPWITEVDRAHVVMLVENAIVKRYPGQRLLAAIDELRRNRYAPLYGREAPRGLYLLYEGYLIERCGHESGGILQTARSRNDLNATVLRLRLRAVHHRLVREALRLQAVLLRRAVRYQQVVMPAYTHGQPAVPITYGHYLSGVEQALGRDVAGLLAAGQNLEHCPLGAGAVGGTGIAIDTERTASLLGFRHPVRHSIDAVASRDIVLRVLAAAVTLGVTLSRLAQDLITWCGAEMRFLALPDSLVGSSSMMPQKRNPFLLEHVKGKSTAALGAFTQAATAMHSTPFTNCIAVGGEAVAPVWGALAETTTAVVLARLTTAGTMPQEERMLECAVDGYTVATALADRLVVGGMDFRSAHKTVGMFVNQAVAEGTTDLAEIAQRRRSVDNGEFRGIEPRSVAQTAAFGGGPGTFTAYHEQAREKWASQYRHLRVQATRWATASAKLSQAVEVLLESPSGKSN